MYALMAICTTLSPGPSDESIMSIVKEHYGDQLAILQRGGDEAVETFKELFLGACPKYLSVNPPPYEDAELLEQYAANPPQDPTLRHLELFLTDVKAVKGVNASRNLLKLYTSIDAAKLAAFLEEESEGDKEEEVLEQLMVLKAASRTYARGQGEASLLDGERIVTNNLDFTIDGVSTWRVCQASVLTAVNGTRRGDHVASQIRWLLHQVGILDTHSIELLTSRNAEHAQRVFNTIRTAPLPSKPKPQGATAGQANSSKPTGQQGGALWAAKKQVRITA